MNPNRLIKDIKMELGIGTFISTRYSDYDLLEVILHKARMIFSRIYGYDLFIPHIEFKAKDAYNSKFLAFRLPEYILDEMQFEESAIIDVRQLNMAPENPLVAGNTDDMYRVPIISPSQYPGGSFGADGGFWSNFYTGYQPTYYQQGMSSFLGIAQVGMSMEYYRKPIKARFRSPNVIEFDPRGMSPFTTDFELRLKVGHAKNLMTIDEAHYYIFKNLAIFDIQEFLWNTELKGLDGLSNGYDNISLKIDDWAEASNRRNEYIKELEADIVLMEGISTY